jgi:HEAT repeat protein
MADLPPEDRPDDISIGPIGSIPIIDEDDPRFEAERAAWSAANKKAQALHSADELLQGVGDADWRVRHESVQRLVARWSDDPRTLDAIMSLATGDEAWQVRGTAVMKLLEFDPTHVEATARRALEDEHQDVRWSAQYVLWQSGSTDEPPPGVD